GAKLARAARALSALGTARGEPGVFESVRTVISPCVSWPFGANHPDSRTDSWEAARIETKRRNAISASHRMTCVKTCAMACAGVGGVRGIEKRNVVTSSNRESYDERFRFPLFVSGKAHGKRTLSSGCERRRRTSP